MNSRKLVLGCTVVTALGVIFIVAGVIIAISFIPDASSQIPPGAVPILLNINLPLNGAQLPLQEPVSVYGEAMGEQPIRDLELWVDGVLNPTKIASSPLNATTVSSLWSWTPAEEGIHRLQVSAIGPEGEVANEYYTSSISYSVTIQIGNYVWQVSAQDGAGNWGQPSQQCYFYYDV